MKIEDPEFKKKKKIIEIPKKVKELVEIMKFSGDNPGLRGRARDDERQQPAGRVRAVGHLTRPQRRAPNRGHIRHRRQQCPHRLRAGQIHRQAEQNYHHQ